MRLDMLGEALVVWRGMLRVQFANDRLVSKVSKSRKGAQEDGGEHS